MEEDSAQTATEEPIAPIRAQALQSSTLVVTGGLDRFGVILCYSFLMRVRVKLVLLAQEWEISS